MVAKALASAADEVVIDLEDAVPADLKDAARASMVALLASAPPGRRTAVRVNAVGTPWCHQDIVALAQLAEPPASIVVPKVESAGDIAFVERLLTGASGRAAGQGIRIQALIESAPGLVQIDLIAGASAALEALVLGYADLSASLGRDPDDAPWDTVRERLLWAARGFGLRAIDGPHLAVAVDDAFRQGLDAARRCGLDGKWVIHPDQIDAVNAAFTPDAEQVAWAGQVLAALAEGERAGLGAVALDGAMLDEAIAVRARRVLARAQAR
jgi:citrate lyase subunit beta/citryl-CoA lyase